MKVYVADLLSRRHPIVLPNGNTWSAISAINRICRDAHGDRNRRCLSVGESEDSGDMPQRNHEQMGVALLLARHQSRRFLGFEQDGVRPLASQVRTERALPIVGKLYARVIQRMGAFPDDAGAPGACSPFAKVVGGPAGAGRPDGPEGDGALCGVLLPSARVTVSGWREPRQL